MLAAMHSVLYYLQGVPDSKVHGANMGPIWGRQDPGGPHVGPMNFAIWGLTAICGVSQGYSFNPITALHMELTDAKPGITFFINHIIKGYVWLLMKINICSYFQILRWLVQYHWLLLDYYTEEVSPN